MQALLVIVRTRIDARGRFEQSEDDIVSALHDLPGASETSPSPVGGRSHERQGCFCEGRRVRLARDNALVAENEKDVACGQGFMGFKQPDQVAFALSARR